MKNIYLIGIMILMGWAFHQLLPWWGIAVAGFIIGVMNDENLLLTFGITFLGGALLWGGMAFWLDYFNEGILSNKMAALFGLGDGRLMIVITFVFGGLFAGLGGMSGRSIRAVFNKE